MGYLRIKGGQTKDNRYGVWRSMKQRCYDENFSSYYLYGSRGITIDDSWLGKEGFFNFIEDVGERPHGTTIDRLDSNGNYTKDNCRWATPEQQSDNRRNARRWLLDGKEYTPKELAKKYNIRRSTLDQRLYVYHWSVERAVNTPVRKRG
jgi:hypothetical protein